MRNRMMRPTPVSVDQRDYHKDRSKTWVGLLLASLTTLLLLAPIAAFADGDLKLNLTITSSDLAEFQQNTASSTCESTSESRIADNSQQVSETASSSDRSTESDSMSASETSEETVFQDKEVGGASDGAGVSPSVSGQNQGPKPSSAYPKTGTRLRGQAFTVLLGVFLLLAAGVILGIKMHKTSRRD